MDRSGRILAVDYGAKNIGVACSDELGVTVSPLPSFSNLGRRDLVRRLRSMARSFGIQELVIGIPFNMDGTAGESARRMERLMDVLKAELKVAVNGVDERLSTVEALEVWQGMSLRQQKKYRTVDSLAAAFILERYLRES